MRLDIYIERVEQADPVTSVLEGQVVEMYSGCTTSSAQQVTPEPKRHGDPITEVWQVTGARTAPGIKMSLANFPITNKTEVYGDDSSSRL